MCILPRLILQCLDFHRLSESQHFKLGDTSCLVSWRHFINTKHLEATMCSGNSTSYFFVCLGLYRVLSNLRYILSTTCVLNMLLVQILLCYNSWWQACSSLQTWLAGAMLTYAVSLWNTGARTSIPCEDINQ